MHSVPFPRFGILGAVRLVISYFIDFLLFTKKLIVFCISVSVVSVCFLRYHSPLIIYITIYILIIYII